MIGQTIAHYRVTAKLGAGGMGEVFRATDAKLGREVALKVVAAAFAADAQRMQRFQREAQVLASLNHPNIATIHGLEEAGSTRALVMELVEGPTLAERIAQGAVPLEEAVPIARQIAEALEYAHDRGIVHRDLKPANIKLAGEGQVKVLDFGLAKALQPEDSSHSGGADHSPTLSVAATKAGIILGTAAYMAPEQARGKPVDRRADIWAFGAVLFEMLTGRQAFPGETATDILAAVVRADPDWAALPPGVPPRIQELLRRCLTKDAKLRLRDIGEARILLESNWNAGESSQAGTALPSEAGKQRERVWMVAVVTLLAAVIGLTAVVLQYRRAAGDKVPLRVTILPPEGTAFSGNGGTGGPAVISPDGKHLAFVGLAAGRRMLWVRSLGSTTAQMLRGTEEASFPFWSPDSRSLGFFTSARLKRIDVNGGPPTTVCDIPAGAGSRGGSWNRDGIIVFSPNTNSPIMRVPASGGTFESITTLNTSDKIGTHRWPFFLPDQRHFLYLARAVGPGAVTPGAAEGIRVSSVDGKVDKFLVPAVSSMAFASGHLLYVQEGALMAQAFDAEKLEITGEPFPVVDQVQFDTAFSLAAFSVSQQGMLTYQAGGAAETSSTLRWIDRSGMQLGKLGEPALYYDQRISPDGRKVAVSLLDIQNRNIDVWIFEVERGLRTRLTFDGASDRFPVWSPDGSRILFFSSRKGFNDLYIKPSNGSQNEELLLSTGANLYPTDWSADGQTILYFSPNSTTGLDIWTLPMQKDSKPVPFVQTPFNESEARFSPDGKWVAYVSNESGKDEVYVAPFPGPGSKWQVSSSGGNNPVWRHDGKEIVYLASDDKLMSAEVGTQGAEFKVGQVRALFEATPERFAIFRPSLFDASRDARRFLIPSARAQGITVPVTLVVNWTADLKKESWRGR